MTEQFDGLEVTPGLASMDGLGLEHMGAAPDGAAQAPAWGQPPYQFI